LVDPRADLDRVARADPLPEVAKVVLDRVALVDLLPVGIAVERVALVVPEARVAVLVDLVDERWKSNSIGS
jgi:hypothetical protein